MALPACITLRASAAIAFLFLAIPPPLAAQSALAARSFTLSKVTIQGHSRFTADQISEAGGLKKGQPIDLAGIDAAADRLFKTGVLANISYSYSTLGNAMTVEYHINDATNLVPCIYDNFVWFSDAELTAVGRRANPLFDGMLPQTGDLANQVTTALEDFLKQHSITGHVTGILSGKLGGPATGYTLQVTDVSMPVAAADRSLRICCSAPRKLISDQITPARWPPAPAGSASRKRTTMKAICRYTFPHRRFL